MGGLLSNEHTGHGAIVPLLLVVLLSLAPPQVRAQDLDLHRDQPVEITADRIVYESRRQVYVAEGSVHVVQAERRIDADWLVFNRSTRRGIAAGNVRVDDGEAVLEARFVEFDQRGQQGLVLTGRLDLGEDDFLIAAGELIQTARDHYDARSASFTTCRCPDDEDRLPWQINAGTADVELGGYAMVTNTTVDVLGVPALWLPWLIFPVKTDRASGVLPPEFGFGGSNGYEVGLPLFWAARHDVGIIATPRYMSQRGFKPELTVETVYGERSETTLFGSYIRDQNAATYFEDGRERTVSSKNRWAVGFDNDVHLPGGARIRSDVHVVSDNDYVRDFADFPGYRRDRFLESRVFGFGHFGPAGSGAVVAGGVYVDDRQNPDFADRDKFVMQRAPEATLTWLPTPIPGAAGLSFEMDVDYAHFLPYERAEDVFSSRLNAPTYDPVLDGGVVGDDQFLDIGIASIPGSFSTPESRAQFGAGDGVFQEGEPLNDRGHRIVLHPRTALPFRLFDAVEVHPEIGWQQTIYSTRAQSYADRGLLTARVDVSSQAIGNLDLPGLPPLLHWVEPRLGWALVSRAGQSENPLFVPGTRLPQARLRQLSLDNLVLDSADRIESANVATLGAGNRFYVEGPGGPQLYAEVDLSLGYDFSGRHAGHFQQLILDGRIFPKAGVRTDFNVAYDIESERIDQGLFEVAFGIPKWLPFRSGSNLRAGYRYRRDVPLFFENFSQGRTFTRFRENFDSIHQVTGATRLRLSERWAVEYGFGYSFERSILLTNRGTIEYTSGCRCWAVQVRAEQDRTRGFQAALNFTILGFGQDLTNPFAGGGLIGSKIY